MSQIPGTTAYEAAEYRLAQINRQIEQLQEEARRCRQRMARYHGSTLGEAERIATAAEPFQLTPLPEVE